MSTAAGKWLIIIGGILILFGIIFYLFGDKLGWIGNLPGDIRIERENYSFYFPVTTMIAASIVLSLIITFISRFLKN